MDRRQTLSGFERKTESRSQAGLEGFGGEIWPISERVSGDAGTWIALAFVTLGGILSQLIDDIEFQLAYQRSLQGLEQRLETMKAHVQLLQDAINPASEE